MKSLSLGNKEVFEFFFPLHCEVENREIIWARKMKLFRLLDDISFLYFFMRRWWREMFHNWSTRVEIYLLALLIYALFCDCDVSCDDMNFYTIYIYLVRRRFSGTFELNAVVQRWYKNILWTWIKEKFFV